MSATTDELQQYHINGSDGGGETLDMKAVSMVGLVALIIFTVILIIITIVVVRFRSKDNRDKNKDGNAMLEEYRRVPLIPLEGANLCCDSANSSTKSCSCYTRWVKTTSIAKSVLTSTSAGTKACP